MEKISRKLFLKRAVAGLAAIAVAPNLLSCSDDDSGEELRKIAPVVGDYDVVVVGGGPAGFIAAIAAARKGAKVALIERYGFLGGMATIGYVAPISVFAKNNELVIGGIPWEFVKRLESMGGAFIEWPKANIDFDIELYKLCCQRMVLEAGVELYMHSAMVGCEMDGKSINSVRTVLKLLSADDLSTVPAMVTSPTWLRCLCSRTLTASCSLHHSALSSRVWIQIANCSIDVCTIMASMAQVSVSRCAKNCLQ